MLQQFLGDIRHVLRWFSLSETGQTQYAKQLIQKWQPSAQHARHWAQDLDSISKRVYDKVFRLATDLIQCKFRHEVLEQWCKTVQASIASILIGNTYFGNNQSKRERFCPF